MHITNKSLAAVTALSILSMTSANASIITAGSAGGSEAVLTLTNSSNATITQDLGKQIGQINAGDTFDLSTAVQSFISAAGGFSSVSFAVIAGNSVSRTYMTTTADGALDTVDIANSERNVWAGTLNNLIPTLNLGDATATSVNNTYGPLATGAPGNYLDGGFDLWNGAYVVNTGLGNADLFLYKVLFGTNNLQNAAITPFFASGLEDSFARLVPAGANPSYLQIGNLAVPVPAAVWLFGSGLGLLGALRRRVQA